jgi:hypothetical protein
MDKLSEGGEASEPDEVYPKMRGKVSTNLSPRANRSDKRG